ncbi:hypothetical protein D4R51_02965, partial [bacterium]
MRVEEFGVGFPPRFFGFRKYIGEKILVISEEEDIRIEVQEEKTIIAEKIKEVDKLVPVKFWRFFWGREKLGEKTNGFSGGTVYSFNFLPFGGFVRLYGEDEAAADMAAGKAGKREERGFNDELAWKKALVIIAGVFMNVVLGWLLLSSVFMIGVPKH